VETSVKSAASRFAGVLGDRFRMGSPPDEPDRRPDEAQVEVALSKGSWIGKYEVTQASGDKLSSKQANFNGEKPYNGAEKGLTSYSSEKIFSISRRP
jgi:hypothetical protein